MWPLRWPEACWCLWLDCEESEAGTENVAVWRVGNLRTGLDWIGPWKGAVLSAPGLWTLFLKLWNSWTGTSTLDCTSFYCFSVGSWGSARLNMWHLRLLSYLIFPKFPGAFWDVCSIQPQIRSFHLIKLPRRALNIKKIHELSLQSQISSQMEKGECYRRIS